MPNMVFARKEMKYMIPPDRYADFTAELLTHMKGDKYGEYTTCNVYYDTDIFNLIRMSMDRPLYKEKLRVRSYGVPTPGSNVFVEIKKKYDGIVYKRRETMPYTVACDFLDRGIYPDNLDSQIMREIRYFMEYHRPVPKLFLAYDRIAYAAQNPAEDVRLTMDSSIRYRFDRVALHEGMEGEQLLSPGEHLMEIKTATAIPLWLCEMLDRYRIRRISFSKYGKIYEKNWQKLGGPPPAPQS